MQLVSKPKWHRFKDKRGALGVVAIRGHFAICFVWFYWGNIAPGKGEGEAS